jgi:hypothetical protein
MVFAAYLIPSDPVRRKRWDEGRQARKEEATS